MLSIFPDLLSLSLVAPLLLRVTLGVIVGMIGYKIVYKYRGQFFKFYQENKYPMAKSMPLVFGYLAIVTGIFLVIGFLTQIATLVAIYIFASLYLIDKDLHIFEYQKHFYILTVVVSVSLLFLGPGILAIDLPL
jgi:uncharacterized membrane protein YphA (DoxX/SURF4 family)